MLDVICGGKIDEMGRCDLENTNSDEHQQHFWEVGSSMNLTGLAAVMSVDMALL